MEPVSLASELQKTAAANPPRPLRLGEELPVFCERCGYALHGLPPVRCDHCQILHMRCPECGHTQPVNTLRPAVQRILGRARAAAIVIWMLIKLNIIFWPLFGWGAMGYNWSYSYGPSRQPQRTVVPGPGGTVTTVWNRSSFVVRRVAIDWESVLAFGLFGLATGLVLRMLLLRWRRDSLVGLVLAGLVLIAITLGAYLREHQEFRVVAGHPFTREMWMLMGIAFCCVTLAAAAVFPIWSLLVRLLLPARVATDLLDWQRASSNQVSALARQ